MYFSDNPSDRYYERMMVGIPIFLRHYICSESSHIMRSAENKTKERFIT